MRCGDECRKGLAVSPSNFNTYHPDLPAERSTFCILFDIRGVIDKFVSFFP